MPRVELPELHEGRDGVRETFKLVNQIKRRFNLVGNLGASVPSASTLFFGADGDYFHVTGSTAVDFVDVTWLDDGDAVELYFDDGTTLNHNTATPPDNALPFKLAGAVNAVMGAGTKIRLRADGLLAQMVEMWRGAA